MFHAYCSLCHAEDVTNLDIVATYDPARDFRAIASPQLADLGANLSGCSGGPLLMHVVHNGLHRIFPVALVMKAVALSPTLIFTGFVVFISSSRMGRCAARTPPLHRNHKKQQLPAGSQRWRACGNDESLKSEVRDC